MSLGVTTPAYRDPNLPTPARVEDLLGRMTLAEKTAQMVGVWNDRRSTLFDEGGAFDRDLAAKNYPDGLGQVGRPGDAAEAVPGALPAEFACTTNSIQRYFVEQTRLGIPVVFHDEALHGLVACDATSFGQPIALASTFNPGLVQELYRVAAREARACGIHQVLGPVLDVARDPRWGRVEETFGEDPYLVSELALAAVLGLQGTGDLSAPDRVVATLKHFAAHGQPESGTNCGPVSVSERHLREVFLEPFRRAIGEGRAQSVMASYNEIDGVPSHASRWLLRDVLRDEWGFNGTVVSDYYAIGELHDRPGLYGHHVAVDAAGAAVLAVRAGVNVELPEPDCYLHLRKLVDDGRLLEQEIDALVRPILAQKFDLGLFEQPYVSEVGAEECLGSDSHQRLALEAARQSIVLLKNNGVLPLGAAEPIRRIAVIGPNADRELLGGYSGRPRRFVTVLEGLNAALGDSVQISYSEGCGITDGGGWEVDEVVPADPAEDRRKIADAVAAAEQADLVVLAVGGNEQTSREAWMSNHLGDRADLQMVGRQDELVDALHATGKPIVSLLFNGRPLAVENLAEKSSALLECWYLGQESGAAVADVLVGKTNPSGRLPITFPRSVGHLPAFYNHRPSARRGYLFDDTSPLFPFGFGLSYCEVAYGPPTLEKPTIILGQSTSVTVTLTNQGDRPVCEVVQMYVRDLVSSVTRPVLELKGVARVSLEPGESRVVKIPVTRDSLAFWNLEKRLVVEPGEFDILVGPNCQNLASARLEVCPV